MTDLGTLGGTNGEGFDVNARGDVVGTADTSGERRARVSMAKRRDDRLEHDDPGRLRMDSEIGARHFRRRPDRRHRHANGVTRAFTPDPAAIDLALSPYGSRSQEDGNLPRPAPKSERRSAS